MANINLFEAQRSFAYNLGLLLVKAKELNLPIILGEVLRTKEQQALYVKRGLSKTYNSYHLKRCAVDILVMRNGKISNNPKDYQALGEYWESLFENNRSGFYWGWDLGHFETHTATAPRGFN